MSRKPRIGTAVGRAWQGWLPTGCLSLLAVALAPAVWAGDGPGSVGGSTSASPGKSGTVMPAQPADGKEVEEAPKVDLEGRVEDRAPLRSQHENEWEFTAFYGTLVTAEYTTAKAFANSARRDVTYAHLYQEPSHYRGTVIHYEGRMRRLLPHDAPKYTWNQGVKEYYEGWVFNPEVYGANPMCVVFTELPKGLKPGDNLDRRVRFDGYFFKLYGYKAADDKWHACPMLIGHAPVLVSTPSAKPAGDTAKAEPSFSTVFMMSFIGVVGLTAGLIVALNLWYRRGDQRTHSRLTAARSPEFVEPTFEDERQPDKDVGTSW
jgi:hypothetical protein